jgi:hypothetical protein
MVQWRGLVNTVMNLRVPKIKKKKGREFLDQPSDCQLLEKELVVTEVPYMFQIFTQN